jgi:hypothetical protein
MRKIIKKRFSGLGTRVITFDISDDYGRIIPLFRFDNDTPDNTTLQEKLDFINQVLAQHNQEPLTDKEISWNSTYGGLLGFDHITESFNVDGDNISTDNITPADRKFTTTLLNKLHSIEEKSECGSVKFLDFLSDKMIQFANWQIKLSAKVRNFTTKINAPCHISFKVK